MSDRDHINQIGKDVLSLLAGTPGSISIAAHSTVPGCRNGAASVTIENGGIEATATAVGLFDAILLCRAKLVDMHEAAQKKRDGAKAA